MAPAGQGRQVLEGVLWVVAIGALAGLWFFPDAISRLRGMGTNYAETERSCDLGAGPCSVAFADGVEVVFRASPQPVRQGEPLSIEVTVDGPSIPQSLEIQGADMPMGFLKLPFETDEGRFTLAADLPACTTDRMLWKADVVLDDRVAGFYLWSTK